MLSVENYTEIQLKKVFCRWHSVYAKQVHGTQNSCFTYREGDKKKCNRCRKSFQEKMNNFKIFNVWLPLHFMLWNGGGKPVQKVVVSKKVFTRLYYRWTSGRLSETLRVLYLLFCMQRQILKKPWINILFPSLFQKNADVSIFKGRWRVIIAVNFPIWAIGKKKPEKNQGFFFPIAQIGKFTAMITLHFLLQPQYKINVNYFI